MVKEIREKERKEEETNKSEEEEEEEKCVACRACARAYRLIHRHAERIKGSIFVVPRVINRTVHRGSFEEKEMQTTFGIFKLIIINPVPE